MNAGIVVVMLATAAFVKPNPHDNFYNFLDIVAATKHCAGIKVNIPGIEKQIASSRSELGIDDGLYTDARSTRQRIADAAHEKNSYVFCRDATLKLNAYNPAYLKRIGITD